MLVQSPCPMKYLFFTLIAISTLLLNSCKIDGEEEITINEDGSAHLLMRYEVPAMFLSAEASDELVKSIDDGLGKKEHVELLDNRVELVKSQKIIHIEFKIDAEADLDELYLKNEEGDEGAADKKKSDQLLESLVGDLDAKIQGLSVDMTRRVDLQPLLEKYMGKKSASMLSDYEFRYTIHLPEAAEQSNAHEVSDGGKTLKWTYLLREVKENPIVMDVTAPIPLPWWVYALVGAVVLVAVFVLVGIGYWVSKRFRQKSIA